MSAEQVLETRGESVLRMAIFTSVTTIADCPLESVCVSMITDPRRIVTCDYYRGKAECGWPAVKCGYQGE